MALVSQREYARRHGLAHSAVVKRTVEHGGPIPTHGPKKQIDEAEADAIWQASMRPNGAANSRFQTPGGAAPPPAAPPPPPDPLGPPTFGTTAATLWQARTAMLLTEAQLKRLQLEERRGLVINRAVAVRKAFGFARTLRDACLTWPARVGPQLAAAFELDAAAVTVYLDEHVRHLLSELAAERVEF